MRKNLAQALDRLANAPLGLAPVAVQAVLQVLETSPSYRDVSDAVAGCLSSSDKAAVEIGVAGLRRFVSHGTGGISSIDAIELLISALVTSGHSSVSPIIAGIIDVVQDTHSECSDAALYSQPHPLLRALLVVPNSAPEVVSAVFRHLCHFGGDSIKAKESLRIFLPFFSAILLVDMLPAGERLGRAAVGLAASCHSQLVRIACTCPSLQVPVLELLVNHLSLYEVSDAAQRSWVLPATADLMDAIETCRTRAQMGNGIIQQLAHALVAMAYDMAIRSLPLGAVLHALSRLHRAWENDPSMADVSPLAHHTADIGQLSLLASGSDKLHCLALICGLLRIEQQDSNLPLDSATAARDEVLQFCGVNATAFQPIIAVRSQGALLINLVKARGGPGGIFNSKSLSSCHGELLLAGQAQMMLSQCFSKVTSADANGAIEWLVALSERCGALQHKQAQTSSSRWSPLLMSEADWKGPNRVSQPVVVVCACLVGHENEEVVRAATLGLGAAAAAAPESGLSMLPPLLHNLQLHVSSSSDEPNTVCASRCLLLLNSLSLLATHQATVGAILATVKTFVSAASATPLLKCLAMRMLLRVWRTSGKGWSALRLTLLASEQEECSTIRLSRAACVRDICRDDGNKGVQMVTAIEQAISDSHPGVVALGLDALCSLCGSDHLCFYGAYRVVVKFQPTLPQSSTVAQRWIYFLSFGALDAMVYPDAAAALIQLLWAAAGHPEESVRCQAYKAIAAYPIPMLEKLEIPCDLSAYIRPLLSETDLETAKAAQALAEHALAHESSRRRRNRGLATSHSARRVAAQTGSLFHRMATVLPRRLCGNNATASGTHLLCYLPVGSPAVAQTGSSIAQMVTGYLQTFRDVGTSGYSGASIGNWEGQHVYVMLACWRQFLARWLQACRAQQLAQQSDDGLEQ
mmetsp:Transcript_12810/g.35976  ORF Transcript_12810/g.35976 Transcript_12810/m.35976 type:complete len:921 (-) Transcript_12810:2966-5728(-)